jgi:glutamine amidotransferase-like uncharacterized protein
MNEIGHIIVKVMYSRKTKVLPFCGGRHFPYVPKFDSLILAVGD